MTNLCLTGLELDNGRVDLVEKILNLMDRKENLSLTFRIDSELALVSQC